MPEKTLSRSERVLRRSEMALPRSERPLSSVVYASCSGGPGGLARAGETGDRSPGPHKFYLLGGTVGPPIFLKLALLTDIVLFLGSLLFLHTLCVPFWRLGPFSVRALKAWSPTSELIYPGLGLAKFTHPPSSRRYIHSACKRARVIGGLHHPFPPLCRRGLSCRDRESLRLRNP